MRKWLIFSGAAGVIAIAAIYALLSNLGPVIRNAVNVYGPQIAKTDVRVEDVHLSLFSGDTKLKEFYLGNPKGFQSSQAMKVKSIYVRVERNSLAEETIVIDKIEVVCPEITYEKGGGSDNFKIILGNVQKSTGIGSGNGGKPARKVLIRDFIVRGGRVSLVRSSIGGNTITTDLPDFHFRNRSSEGKPPSEAFGEVFGRLYQQMTEPVAKEAVTQGVRDVQSGTRKGVNSVTTRIRGFFGK